MTRYSGSSGAMCTLRWSLDHKNEPIPSMTSCRWQPAIYHSPMSLCNSYTKRYILYLQEMKMMDETKGDYFLAEYHLMFARIRIAALQQRYATRGSWKAISANGSSVLMEIPHTSGTVIRRETSEVSRLSTPSIGTLHRKKKVVRARMECNHRLPPHPRSPAGLARSWVLI